METLLLTLGIVLLSVAGLAAGLFFGRPPIKGSCGGLACLEDGAGCAACAHRRQEEQAP